MRIPFDLILAAAAASSVGAQADIRWQQVTSDTLNYPHLVKYVLLRRDGLHTSPTAQNRVVDIEMAMGGCGSPPSGVTFGNAFDANWRKGTETTNLVRTTINLPNWSQLAGTSAPFDLVIPVNTIWAHTGFVYLLFELQVWDTQGAGLGTYQVDAVDATGLTSADVTRVGSGCGAFVNTTGFTVNGVNPANNASTLTTSVTGAPPVSPIGASDASGIMAASLPTGVERRRVGRAALYSSSHTRQHTDAGIGVRVEW